uniref:GBBH-like_N domain-containing protein n=1 Tax=Panagrellus redivivus TaxID=6233 RepID=A0A7E4VS03_PANRE
MSTIHKVVKSAIQATKSYHNAASVAVHNAASKTGFVELKFAHDDVKLPLVWLRDHCRSAALYNSQTNQRKSNATNLFDKARIASSDSVTFNPEKQVLTILWNDGHKRQFRIQELVSWAVQPAEYPPIELWNSTSLRKVPRTSLKNFDFAKFCLDFVKYGVVTVDDVDPTPEATETLCRAIAPIHDTFFGDFWVFGTDEETSQF